MAWIILTEFQKVVQKFHEISENLVRRTRTLISHVNLTRWQPVEGFTYRGGTRENTREYSNIRHHRQSIIVLYFSPYWKGVLDEPENKLMQNVTIVSVNKVTEEQVFTYLSR